MQFVAKMQVSALNDAGELKPVGHGERTFSPETLLEDAQAEVRAWIQRNQEANKNNPKVQRMRWKVDLHVDGTIVWTYEVPSQT